MPAVIWAYRVGKMKVGEYAEDAPIARENSDAWSGIVGEPIAVEEYVRAELARRAIVDLTNRLHAVETVLRDCVDPKNGLYRLGHKFALWPLFSAEEEATSGHARDLFARASSVMSRSR